MTTKTENPFPSFELTGQTALVTGAARGLGRAISLALAHAGADVALGLRDATRHGGLVETNAAGGPLRICGPDGELLAIADVLHGRLKYRRVLRPAD